MVLTQENGKKISRGSSLWFALKLDRIICAKYLTSEITNGSQNLDFYKIMHLK